MTRRLPAFDFLAFMFVALACGGALTAWQQPQTPQPPVRDQKPFQSGVEVTSINATVLDGEGHLITGLDRDAFEVFEDGEPQQITQFTNERVPVGLGVLIDISDSMFGARIQDARAAVDRFLLELLDPSDEFFLLAFNHRPHMLTEWTAAPDVVRGALDNLKPSGGTAVYDAVVASLPMIERRNRQRAAVVVISDGADTASTANLRDLRSALLRSDAFVYAIAIDPPEKKPINTRVNPTALREFTDSSGGSTQIVSTSGELVAATARIAEELNSQYLMGYVSSHGADGQFHSIRVRAKGYRVRARNGYVATQGKKKGSE